MEVILGSPFQYGFPGVSGLCKDQSQHYNWEITLRTEYHSTLITAPKINGSTLIP